MYQMIIVAGNLGGDPEMRFTPEGKAVTNFSLASNRQYVTAAGETVKEVTWFRVSVWGKQAEPCNKYLAKGSKVLVTGRLACDLATGGPKLWKDSEGVAHANFEIMAQHVQFLSTKTADAQPAGNPGDDSMPF